jgi:hypothetical protein
LGLADLHPGISSGNPEDHPGESVRIRTQDCPRNKIQEKLRLGVSDGRQFVRFLEHFQVYGLDDSALEQVQVFLENQLVVLELLMDCGILFVDFVFPVFQKRIL